MDRVVDRAPLVVVVVDHRLRIREAPPVGAPSLGRSRDHLVGRSWGEVFGCAPAHEPSGCGSSGFCQDCPVKRMVGAAVEHRSVALNVTWSFEPSQSPTTERPRYLLCVMPLEQGEGGKVLVSALDLSGRPQECKEAGPGEPGARGMPSRCAERSAAHPERGWRHEAMRRFADKLPAATYRLESEEPFRLLEMDGSLARALGWVGNGAESIRRTFTDTVHAEDVARVRHALSHAATTGEPYVLSYRVIAFDGTTLQVEDWGGLEPDADGRCLQGMLFDVSETHRRSRLQRVERELAAAISKATSFNVVLDRALQAALEAADGDCAGIYRVESTGGLHLLRAWGFSEAFQASVRRFEAGSLPLHFVETTESFALDENELVEALGEVATEEGVTSAVGVPILQNNSVVGWFVVGSHSRRCFGAPAVEPLQSLAGHFGSALAAWSTRQEYQHVLRTSLDGLLIVAHSGELLEANEAYCQLTGWSREELSKRRFQELDASPDVEGHLAAMTSEVGATYESQHRCKAGDLVDVEVTGRSAPVRGGSLVIVVRDITARIRSDHQLQLLSSVVEQSAEGVMICDPEVRIEYVNRRLTGMTGYSESQLIGRSPNILMVKHLPNADYSSIVRAISMATEWHGETPIGTSDGRVVWTQTSVTPLRDDSGAIRHFVAKLEDVTEQRADHEAMMISEHRLAAALDGAREGLWDWNLDSGEVHLSASWGAIVGLEPSELGTSSQWLFSLIHPEDLDRVHAETDAVASGKLERLDVRYRLRHKNGQYVNVLSRARVSRLGKLATLHMIGTFVDLSEDERIQRQLIEARNQAEAANRAKTAFLSNITHEIRTPMNAILGYAQLLQRERGLSARQRGFVETIVRSGDHLIHIVNSVLAMSQIEAGRAQVSPRPFDWHALLADVDKMFREKAVAKNLRFEVCVDPSVPRHIVSDEVKLRQILINLVGNAIKYTDAGRVELRVRSKPAADGPASHEVVVSDTGIGMARQDLDRVFIPFERVQGWESRAVEGTGLGLPISKEYATLLGGELTMDSWPGMGTAVTFHFPAQPAGDGVVPGKLTPLVEHRLMKLKPELAGTRVLVADDTPSNRELLAGMLRALGFAVLEAPDGRDAIRLFREHTPAVVLLDRKMPGLDGYATMREIRGMVGGGHARILIVSAFAMHEDRLEAKAQRADGFIGKPILESQLISELETVAGLSFVDGGRPSSRSSTSLRAQVAPSGAPDTISPDKASELLRAAEAADADRLVELVGSLGSGQEHVQEVIMQALENYDYDAVISWLERRSRK